MKRGRTGLVAGGVAGVMLLAMALYVIAVLRTCDEGWGVLRGSFAFRLCGVGDEFIASIPTEAAVGDAGYSWTNPDGNKPGRKRLEYETRRAPDEVRAALLEFLRRSGFAPSRREIDKNHEWWENRNTWLGIQVKTSEDGHKTHIEVIHNTGLD